MLHCLLSQYFVEIYMIKTWGRCDTILYMVSELFDRWTWCIPRSFAHVFYDLSETAGLMKWMLYMASMSVHDYNNMYWLFVENQQLSRSERRNRTLAHHSTTEHVLSGLCGPQWWPMPAGPEAARPSCTVWGGWKPRIESRVCRSCTLFYWNAQQILDSVQFIH